MAENSIDIVDVAGKKTGAATLPAEIFDVQTNVPLLHQVVVAQQAAARQGTQSTLKHGEVSGTGNARQGSLRAPQMRGGYITHGPKPRTYEQRTPKKMIAAAIKGALSDRARNGRLHVVAELFKDGAPSTKSAASILAALTGGRKALVVLDRSDDRSYKSLRNLKDVHVLPVDQVNAYDVVLSDDVVFTKAALDEFISTASKSKTEKEG